jgi:TetR/AcrR family transcriptional repressor of nem operon
MLSARAYGDPKIFSVVTGPLLERLAPRSPQGSAPDLK